MANTNNPHGLNPIYTLSGGPLQTNSYRKVATYGTALFPGDAVNRVADGSIEASATAGTTAYTGVLIAGYGAASTATADHIVADDLANTIFEAQGDGSGSLDQADEGLNANLVLTAGNAATKRSKHQIAEGSKNTTNTLDVHLLRLFGDPSNAYGANARFELMFNKRRDAPATAGV